MKLKLLIITAISVVLVAAVVLFSIGRYQYAQSQLTRGLFEACNTGNAAAAAYWLAKGADPNAREHTGETPLMECAHLNADTVELLLLLGADPNAVDYREGNPVLFNATDGYVADTLVLHGADVNKTNREGLTALQYRQKNNYIMDDELKTVLEGNGPASKLLKEVRQKHEQWEKEKKAKEAAATQK